MKCLSAFLWIRDRVGICSVPLMQTFSVYRLIWQGDSICVFEKKKNSHFRQTFEVPPDEFAYVAAKAQLYSKPKQFHLCMYLEQSFAMNFQLGCQILRDQLSLMERFARAGIRPLSFSDRTFINGDHAIQYVVSERDLRRRVAQRETQQPLQHNIRYQVAAGWYVTACFWLLHPKAHRLSLHYSPASKLPLITKP